MWTAGSQAPDSTFLALGYNRTQEVRTLVPGKKLYTFHYMNIQSQAKG